MLGRVVEVLRRRVQAIQQAQPEQVQAAMEPPHLLPGHL
jgi:hypothetical protein